MSPDDIIEIPGHPGKYARRAIVEAWRHAGSPSINSAGRLPPEQKQLYDLYRAGKGSPADNPDETWQPLAHVRFVALDLGYDANPARLRAAGLVCPYDYEPWHWQLPGDVRRYPLVTSIPKPATTTTAFNPIPDQEDDTMRSFITLNSNATKYELGIGSKRSISKAEWAAIRALESAGGPKVIVAYVDQATLDAIPGK